jgi:hypothetical protein
MVAIGLPLSVLAGSSLWQSVASDAGVQPGAVVPAALFLLAPASLTLAVVTSLFASRRVRRSRVADVLRDE